MGGPWLPSATAFFNAFLMASPKVNKLHYLLLLERAGLSLQCVATNLFNAHMLLVPSTA